LCLERRIDRDRDICLYTNTLKADTIDDGATSSSSIDCPPISGFGRQPAISQLSKRLRNLARVKSAGARRLLDHR